MTTQAVTLSKEREDHLKTARMSFRLLSALGTEMTARIAVNRFLTPRKRPLSPKSQAIFEQAYPINIPYGSRELATYVWDAYGPTVLLVHGWEANAGAMRGFVKPLLQQGFRVVAFDAPAHGSSTGKQTNIMDYGGAIQTVMQKVGPVDFMVAHSFGAAATLTMLSRMPEHGVKKVVTLGAPSRLEDMLSVWTGFLGLSPEVKAAMERRIMDRVGMSMASLSVETAVSNLNIPGLIVHDQQDQMVAFSNAEAIHHRWRESDLLPTEGLDHRGVLYNKEVLRTVAAFLAHETVLT
jgi:pimeloyl-ACP methyl ester carboxylesterase